MSAETDKKTPVVPPEPPPITEAEAVHVNKFVSGLFEGRKEKPAKVKGEEEAPKPELDAEGNPIPEKTDDAPPSKPAKKPAKKPEVAAPASPAPPDYDKIAEAAGRGVAEALNKKTPEKKEESPATPEFLSEDEKAELPVLEQMEKSNPTKYKGLTKKFTDAIKARQEYEAAWLKENPGKEFDAEADEHNEFFEKNDVDWKDRDYQEALTDLKVAPAIKRLEEKNLAELDKLSAKEKAKEIEPLAASESKRNGKALFDAVGGEFAKVVGDNLSTNPEVIKALYAEDETRATIVFQAANALEQYAAENLRLFTGVAKFDENNPVHKYLSDFAVHHETAMNQLDREQSKNKNGQVFATAAEYYKMNKETRAKHWTFSARDLNDLLAADQVKAVKLAIEADEKRLNAVIAKRGFKKDPSTEAELPPKPAASKNGGAEEKPVVIEGGDGQLLANRFRGPDPKRGSGVSRLIGGLLGK